jgi:hypothetical protein
VDIQLKIRDSVITNILAKPEVPFRAAAVA